MEFGVPNRRAASSNNEKYENSAVITISELKGKGTGRTITLNSKAIADLGIDFELEKGAFISFSFDSMAKTVAIANTSGIEGVSGVRLAKTSKSVSDKAYFEAIKKNFGIALEDSVELLLTATGAVYNGHPIMSLTVLTATEKLEAVVETATVAPAAENVEAPTAIPAPVPVIEEVATVADVPADAPVETGFGAVEVPQEVVAEQAAAEEANLQAEATQAAESSFYEGFDGI